MQDKIQIDGVSLTLSNPITNELQWIGQEEVLRQLLACWLVVDEKDLPLAPRLVGPPGVGKTALAMAAAKARKQSLYIYQCTADTRPEDLLITPILASDGKIAYHASPLVTAMIKGGVCILDEGNRMNEKSWASLAPLLDHRRYIESIVAGVSIRAHRDFRCAVTMNQDDSTYEIPDYIMSRLQPALSVGFPNREDELAILQYHLPFAAEELLALTLDFLQQSHALQLDYSARDGIQLLRYAMKLLAFDPTHPVAKDQVWRQALVACLGEDALDLQAARERKSRSLGANTLPHGLGDFFLDPNDPMHPDFDEDAFDDDDDLDNDR